MDIAIVGFGRMGQGIAGRLIDHGHRAIVCDPAATRGQVAALGAEGPFAIGQIANLLTGPRIAWAMVPSGDITESVLSELLRTLSPGDILIDGGNSNFRDSQRHAQQAREVGIHFLDIGVSGGIWGRNEGFGLMVGGSAQGYAHVEPLLLDLAPTQGGLVHAGGSGAGHFVKMVHNGIEYGLMQSYAEGIEILDASEFNLDLAAVTDAWRHGTVIRSWLLDLAAAALAREPHLDSLDDYVEDSGEGRWTVQAAIDTNVPAPVITLSLLERIRSRQDTSFSAKVVSALRREFGGHAVKSSS